MHNVRENGVTVSGLHRNPENNAPHFIVEIQPLNDKTFKYHRNAVRISIFFRCVSIKPYTFLTHFALMVVYIFSNDEKKTTENSTKNDNGTKNGLK